MVPAPRLMWTMLAGLLVAAAPTLFHAALWPLVAALWALVAFAALVDFVLLLRAKPALRVEVPAAVGVGSELALRVELEVRSKARLRGVLRSEAEAPLHAGPDLDLRTADGTTEHEVLLDAPRRGGASVRALWLRLQGPLGLFRRIDRHEVDEEVAIVPNAERVRELALAHFGAQRFGGIHVTKKVGDGGEFDALEAYEPGMDLRKVDWKASARHQFLRVRRFRMEQNQRLVLCVDTGRLMADPIEGLERLDHAIHAALLLSRVALKAGDLVGVHAYGEHPEAWVPMGGGMRQMARISRGLAKLESAPAETNHVLGIHGLLGKMRRRSLVVVFTEFTDSTTAELMVEPLGHLAKRHLVVFVALDDPAIEDRIGQEPKTAEDLAGTVVAGGLRQDRERVLRRLKRMGVDVVNGPPGPAALQLLARYVHIKRRGLIG
ncbi:MAG TPA: DUF58 domain-containing protein [Polyangiaceae bacterium LLY-WYZ-15_(1-7)]|nr:DUF58 domain-containing protein [Polyangiaceae bacterium LLY-WYZ-15_(1-7)]